MAAATIAALQKAFPFPKSPSAALLLGAVIAGFLYLVGLAVYRLYFSPIARFPGPKLAALSRWYEFYYDCVLPGQFTFHIQELHKKYGSIIRINPDELHIQDSDFYDELYSRSARRDKYEFDAGRFGNNTSIFTTSNHYLHSLRRSVLNPMFSKRSIVDFQPVIREKLEILCDKIAKYAEGDGKQILCLNYAWSAWAGDLITQYAFGFCYNHLESPGFKESFHEAYMELSGFGHVAIQFPWVHPVFNAIPDALAVKMNPALHMLLTLKRDLKKQILKMQTGQEVPKTEHPTIFYEVLQSSLPPQEKSLQRIGDEAQTIIGAGVETTAWALSIASYHIIANPLILTTLRAELSTVLPSVSSAPGAVDWLTLEKLPYLTACITESIRLSYGLSHRNPRVSHAPLKYKEWTIPAGVPVGMNIVDVQHDESVFPDSHAFLPERWLGSPKTAGGKPLTRYFVAFGKDARSCLGINLAYAEMYLALATVFSRFDFELYETDVSDVQLAHDFYLPAPKLGSKGVRSKVKLRTV